MPYTSFFVLFIFLYNVMCDWSPYLSKKRILSLFKDKYNGCSFNLNNNLFDFISLIYEYDKDCYYYSSVWLDVGANRGEVAKYVGDVVPYAKIFAFEPFDPVYKSLNCTLSDYKNIEVLNIGVSNTTEDKRPFYTRLGSENDDIFDRSSLEKLFDDYFLYKNLIV